MSLLEDISKLVSSGDIKVSDHGYDELADDGLSVREMVEGLPSAVLIEEYPDYPKGPCVLLLLYDRCGNPVHAVWGIPKGFQRPAVLVTAYRPDPSRWDDSLTRRC